MEDPHRDRHNTIKPMLKKAIKIIASVLSTAVILLAAVILVLYLFRIRPYVVTTPSMEPEFSVNSVCFVNERTSFDEIKIGDVIVFRIDDSTLVTHRVIRIEDGKCITKGDANNVEDSAAVTAENYVGKTVMNIPKVGVILEFLHTKAGMITAVTVVLLLIILSFVPTDQHISQKNGHNHEKKEDEKLDIHSESGHSVSDRFDCGIPDQQGFQDKPV